MPITIKQSAHPDDQHPSYWKWSVWLEGEKEELDLVEEVTYTLHPTFKNKKRRIKARSRKFKLSTSGWGEFMIYARVKKKTGDNVELNHWLKLQVDSESETINKEPYRIAKNTLRIFLSHSASDTRFADSLRASLENKGVHVASSNTIYVGSSLAESIKEEIKNSDAIVLLISSSSYVSIEWESWVAQQNNIPIIIIVKASETDNIPLRLKEYQRFLVKDFLDPDALAENIEAGLADLIGLKK